MAKPEWGTKHRCTSCAARFYDFNKSPLICPKCGAENQPEVLLKPKRSSSSEDKKTPKAPVAKAPVAEEADTEDDDIVLDDDNDDDVVLDDDDDDIAVVVDDDDDLPGGDDTDIPTDDDAGVEKSA